MGWWPNWLNLLFIYVAMGGQEHKHAMAFPDNMVG